MFLCIEHIYKEFKYMIIACMHLLPTGSEEREVLGAGSVPVAILPSCHDMNTTALKWHKQDIVG